MYQAKLPAQSPDTNQAGSGKIRLHALLTLWGSRFTSLKAGFISASRTGTSWKNLSFHDYSTGGRPDVPLNEHIFLLLKSWRTHCFITSHLGKAHLPKSPVASYLTTHYLQKSGWLWEAGKIKLRKIKWAMQNKGGTVSCLNTGWEAEELGSYPRAATNQLCDLGQMR